MAGIRTHGSVSSFSDESENGFLSLLSAASSSRPWSWAEEEEGGSRRGRLWFFSKKNENDIDPALVPAQWKVIDGCDGGGTSTRRWRDA